MRLKILNSVLTLAGLVVTALTASAALLEFIPEQSKIEVAVSCTVDSFVGKLEKFQASVECDPAATQPASAEVSFDFADLKTGNLDRDAAMLKWLEYTTNRTCAFHLTGWQRSGTNLVALGQLTIHGVTLPVQMPTTTKQDGNSLAISGQAAFDYRDFKLSKIRKALVLTVDPKLKVTFHLVGKTAAAK